MDAVERLMSGLRCSRSGRSTKFSLGKGFFWPPLRSPVALIGSKPQMVLRSLFDAEESPARLPRYPG